MLDYKTPGLQQDNSQNTLPDYYSSSDLAQKRIPKKKVYATPLLSKKKKLSMSLTAGNQDEEEGALDFSISLPNLAGSLGGRSTISKIKKFDAR